MASSPRRIFVPRLELGRVALPAEAERHLVSVLRLGDGDEVEPFDGEGRVGRATLVVTQGGATVLEVTHIDEPIRRSQLVVASAVPKGDRADFLVEKLSEIGVLAWQPLRTARSVVEPKGESKTQRWQRIAQEAARQSHAPGVMEIRQICSLQELPGELLGGAWFASLTPEAIEPGSSTKTPGCVLVGPEGGWTGEEEEWMRSQGVRAVTLGETVLRVETAAVLTAWAASRTMRERSPDDLTHPTL